MKKQIRLYNIILPIWLLIVLPQVWLIVLPANLIIDGLVLLLTLCWMKHGQKAAVLGQVWWKIWLLGFAADFVGVAFMILGMLPCLFWPSSPFGRFWGDTVGHEMHNAFRSPGAFLLTLAAVLLAGVFIYFFDRKALRSCPLLTAEQGQKLALAMALFTMPWFFFWPVY